MVLRLHLDFFGYQHGSMLKVDSTLLNTIHNHGSCNNYVDSCPIYYIYPSLSISFLLILKNFMKLQIHKDLNISSMDLLGNSSSICKDTKLSITRCCFHSRCTYATKRPTHHASHVSLFCFFKDFFDSI